MRSRNVVAITFAVVLFIAACSAVEDEVPELERNKNAVRQFVESLGTNQYAPTVEEFASADFALVRSEFQNLESNGTDPVLADAAQAPDVAITNRDNAIVALIAEGDMVGVQYRIKGTHAGNLFGVAATGKEFDIDAVALFRLANGKIAEAWYMADEAGLLRQLSTGMPARSDGQRVAAPIRGQARAGDIVLAELLANPVDSQAYRNKLMVAAYKSANPPPGILPDKPGRPYEQNTRAGFFNLGERGVELGHGALNIPQAYPDRIDKIGYLLSDGEQVFMQFRLTGTNTNSLFGMPPSNGPVDAWEIGIMQFEGSHWKYGWFFGDDLGMLLQINGPQEFLFPATVD